jgi:urea transporter/murein DD-endopeptidase MepM/ murein hydrolase activator NlpD
MLAPRPFAFGILAVFVSTITSLALSFDRDTIASGAFGYNALLVGLGVGATFTGLSPALPTVVLASIATVVVTAALRSWLAPVALPPLSLPFLAVFYLLLGAAGLARLPYGPFLSTASVLDSVLPDLVLAYLRTLGSLFFLARADAGLLVLVALTVNSRIGTALSLLSFGAVVILDRHVLSLADGSMLHVLGYNAVLTGIALGGVWFVPSRSSFLLAVFGVLVGTLVTVGSMPALARVGAPVLILPFNATMFLAFLAMRQRTRDENPKAVDFLMGTPEENLDYYRTRVARFGGIRPMRFAAPFLGTWQCTQGEDGRITHQGPWRHAFDFEVVTDGKAFRNEGRELGDYRCYKLPVIASAAGVVAKVVDRVRDNAIGKIDVEHNWGNVVVVKHAEGLFSLVAHLAPGSIKVREGDYVVRGAVLGACGSSGRSPYPHLHFQLQSTAIPGSATVPCRFSDLVLPGEHADRVEGAALIAEGEQARNLEPADEASRFIRLPYGSRMTLRDESAREETLESDVDLFGRQLLRSVATGAVLYFSTVEDHVLIAYEVLGTSHALRILEAALARVPFEQNPRLVWTDRIAARPHRPPLLRFLFDAVSPLVADDSVKMTYRQSRDDGHLVIEGESSKVDRTGKPWIRTRVVMERDVGIVGAELRIGSKAHKLERIRNEGTP